MAYDWTGSSLQMKSGMSSRVDAMKYMKLLAINVEHDPMDMAGFETYSKVPRSSPRISRGPEKLYRAGRKSNIITLRLRPALRLYLLLPQRCLRA